MRYELNGTWEMTGEQLNKWVNATVPGSVYLDLLNHGLMEDPFYRDNEKKSLKLMENNYYYRRFFEVDEDMLKRTNYLICEGLDTLATIKINGQVIASCDNMHRTYRFLLSNILKLGKNLIEIDFDSSLEYIKNKVSECPYQLFGVGDAVKGYMHIRKGHSMFGWDWGPQLPDAGIWKDIYIESTNVGFINDLYIKQTHEENKVLLDFVANNTILEQATFHITVKSPTGETLLNQKDVASNKQNYQLEINEPQIWWPVGYGKQPLYTISIELFDGDILTDSKEYKVGLRTIDVKREKDQYGESFTFVVNGLELFVKGANYIPEDNLLGRNSKEKTKNLLNSIIEANHNMIRIWGGGHYPLDYFYDLCDEMGILVWQDLMFACSVYNMEDQGLISTIIEEIKDNVTRIRHHASLALICGNNENETMVAHWNIPDLEISKKFYLYQFEELLPNLVKEIFPEVNYWLSSPSSGGNFIEPNNDNMGDMHYWGVWHNNEPISYYRKYYPRMMSEFGIQSFPSLKTVKTFTEVNDRNIFSYVMECHQKNSTANDKILNYVGKMFKYPKDFDSLLYVSQLIQAEGIRYGVEHWRRNYGRCMGAIYWQLNDCWPVASWSSIDYNHRWKALHYHSKKFYAPVLLSLCETSNDVSVHITNETLKSLKGIVVWKLMDFYGNTIKETELAVEVNSLSAKEISHETIDLSYEKKMNTALYATFLVDGEIVAENLVSFAPDKHLQLPQESIQVEVIEHQDTFELRLVSKGLCKFVEVDFEAFDYILSDNYFFLIPNQAKVVTFKKDQTIEAIKSQLRIRSLVDTY